VVVVEDPEVAEVVPVTLVVGVEDAPAFVPEPLELVLDPPQAASPAATASPTATVTRNFIA
jgi:hypothetical protein